MNKNENKYKTTLKIKLGDLIKNFSLSRTIDWLFFNLCLFLLLFAWIRFATKSFGWATTLSLSILFVINLLIYLFRSKKPSNISQKELEKQSKEFFLNYSALSQKEKNLLAGNSFGKKVKTNLYLQDNKLTLIALEQKTLDISHTLSCAKFALDNDAKKLIVLCNYCPKEDLKMLQSIQNVSVCVVSGTTAYQYFCSHATPPQKVLTCSNVNKIRFRDLANEAIKKSKAKRYFLSGLLIFFCSLVVRYNIYYVFVSSLLFFLSLLCLTKKGSPQEKP